MAEVAVGRVTQLLAEMQTSILSAGLHHFAGDIDRFGIFSLIVRESLRRTARGKAISTHSLAISLSRSFETVRRHVIALTDAGVCVRGPHGVLVRAEILDRPDIAALMRLSHDSFIRFVEGIVAMDDTPIVCAPTTRAYEPIVGIAGAIDVMLATVDSNRAIHRNWLDLALFSTVLYGNFQRRQALGGALGPAHAVRPRALADALNIPETTVRRRLKTMVEADGPLIRCPNGFMISAAWLARPEAVATSARTYANIRLIVGQAAVSGLPLDNPARVYIDGRPSAVVVA